MSLMQQASECAWPGLGGVYARTPEGVGEWTAVVVVVVVLLRGRGVALYCGLRTVVKASGRAHEGKERPRQLRKAHP